VVEAVNKKYPIANYRHHMKHLEISCHAIPWFMLTFGGLYMFNIPELWVNLLLGLVVDIVIVAITKAFTRRRRPAYNIDDLFLTGSVDKFSFPSGHATRAVFLAVFFIRLYSVNFILYLPIVIWSSAVCVSRVLMGRHHILDVLCGVLIGLLEAILINQMWLTGEAAGKVIAAFGGEDPWSGA